MRLFFLSFCCFNLIIFCQSRLEAADFVNFIDMEFANINKGKFNMGACNNLYSEIKQPHCQGITNDPNTFANELPRHSVEIVQSFQIGLHEVSIVNFKHYLETNPSSPPDKAIFKKFNHGEDTSPVVYISWNEVQKFITWINIAKPSNDKGTYRLPTEAEWEYVARAGTESIYFFGNSPKQLGQYAWYDENSLHTNATSPQPVGTKKENPWGVFDIYGNVWEWTADYYKHDYYKNSTRIAPSGPPQGKLKTIRGGSWNFDQTYCRTTAREGYQPHYRSHSIGFRLVRDITK